MAVEGREQVTRIGIVRVNGKPEELDDPDGRRQPSVGGTSRMNREVHVRICEGLGVKFPGPTRRTWGTVWIWSPPVSADWLATAQTDKGDHGRS
jgi:hypothetical protein